jgi:hypothetical protein
MNVHSIKLLSAIAVIASGVSAQQIAAQNYAKDQPMKAASSVFEQGYEAGNQFPAAYNAAARIELNNSWNVFLTGSFIYWYADQDGLDLSSHMTTTALGQTLNAYNAERYVHKFEYKPGFKAALGYHFDNDHWVGEIDYTWLHQKTMTHLTAPDDARGPYPALGPISWYYAASGFTSFNQPPGSMFVNNYAYTYARSLTSTWRLDLDILDASLSRPFYQGQKLTILPFGGIRSAMIRQNFRIAALMYGPGGMVDPNPVVSHNHSNSWSVGPRAGMKGHWLLDWGFRFEGDMSASVLYTSYTKVTMRTDPTPNGSGTAYGPIWAHYNDYNTIRPMADLSFGLGWGSYFDQQHYHFDLLATYDFNIMWGQNMMRALEDAQNSFSSADPGDLHLQGLTVAAQFNF